MLRWIRAHKGLGWKGGNQPRPCRDDTRAACWGAMTALARLTRPLTLGFRWRFVWGKRRRFNDPFRDHSKCLRLTDAKELDALIDRRRSVRRRNCAEIASGSLPNNEIASDTLSPIPTILSRYERVCRRGMPG